MAGDVNRGVGRSNFGKSFQAFHACRPTVCGGKLGSEFGTAALLFPSVISPVENGLVWQNLPLRSYSSLWFGHLKPEARLSRRWQRWMLCTRAPMTSTSRATPFTSPPWIDGFQAALAQFVLGCAFSELEQPELD